MFKRLGVISLLAALVSLAFVGLAQAQTVINMGMVDFAFQPSTVDVASNSVTFDVRNDGRFPHNIAIDGRPGSLFPNDLTAGQSASTTIDLPPGTYTFYCPVPGHREAGMVGTLTVGAAQAGRAGGLDPVMVPAALAVLGIALLGSGYLRRRRGVAQGL
ncbi:MAG: cupredoxin domain-containing protein [Chloroflexi bacterium]|nr:cupredoxin domain-containing protein [Chloroflexota bacterium]